MKKIPIIGAIIAAVLAFKFFKGKKEQEQEQERDTNPGEGHPAS